MKSPSYVVSLRSGRAGEYLAVMNRSKEEARIVCAVDPRRILAAIRAKKVSVKRLD
jgi:hypothetical protein